MKSSNKKTILFLFWAVFLISACSENKDDTYYITKPVKKKSTISFSLSNTTENTKLIIYDYNSESAGLELVSVDLNHRTNITKKDVIDAFLKYNHFLHKEEKISLSKIEEIGGQTVFHLTSVENLKNQKDLPFFKKALELTLLRHLKTNDFNITYGLTAQL